MSLYVICKEGMIIVLYLVITLFVFLICFNYCCKYYKTKKQYTSFNKWMEDLYEYLVLIAIFWPLGIIVVLALYLMQKIKEYYNI